jgi:hypothetical protein
MTSGHRISKAFWSMMMATGIIIKEIRIKKSVIIKFDSLFIYLFVPAAPCS